MVVITTSRSGDDDSTESEKASTTDALSGQPEAVEEPAKVMRIAMMVRQLLEEVRRAGLDETSRKRLRKIHERAIRELSDCLSPDLAEELRRMSRPFDVSSPSEAELRVAQAQLVGWLEGLFHGIQAAVFAQQVEAQLQLEQMRQGRLPSGSTDSEAETESRSGTYL